MNEANTYWYVVYTLPRWEKKVSKLLDDKGYEYYCPLVKQQRKWSDRIKVVEEPLFKGYVFVKVAEENKWNLRSVNGIINFVHWLGKPAKVKQEEIDTIRKFLQEFEEVVVNDTSLRQNDTVVVKQGIFMNFSGMVLEVVGSKAKVLIQSLGIQLEASFKKENLHLVEKGKEA